jgi:DNA recombination protein RmuC
MDWLVIIIVLVVGLLIGLALTFVLKKSQSKTGKEIAEEIFRENESLRQANLETFIEKIKADFGDLSRDALSKSTDEFLKLAKEKFSSEREVNLKELDGKKELIDRQLKQIETELENMSKVARDLEKDRVEKFGELASQLKSANEQTTALRQTTNSLREALASPKIRGQWGERMAEDVLRLAGFVENINYLKQKTIDGGRSRPDFTFILPRDLKLNMDVKFPLDNYIKYLDTESAAEKNSYCDAFLKDVKARIREITTRGYIDAEQQTVDYVLLFIPNEQIYAFIHQHDNSILDFSIKSKVILCSPITLFAILAVIRQAVDNFALEKTSHEILALMGTFKKQWDEFVTKMELMGKRINDAQKEYESLTTTRRRQLERPLEKIESLRTQRDIEINDESDKNLLGAVNDPEIDRDDF